MKRQIRRMISLFLSFVMLLSVAALGEAVRYDAELTTSDGLSEKAALTFGYDDMGFLQILMDAPSAGEWVFETDGTEFAFGAVDGNVYSINKDDILKIAASAFAISAFGMAEDRADLLAAYMTDGRLAADAQTVYALLANEANRIFMTAAEKGIVKIHENGDLEIKADFIEAVDFLIAYIDSLSLDDDIFSRIASLNVFGALNLSGEAFAGEMLEHLRSNAVFFRQASEIMKTEPAFAADFRFFVSASDMSGSMEFHVESLIPENKAEYKYSMLFTSSSVSTDEYADIGGTTLVRKASLSEDGYQNYASVKQPSENMLQGESILEIGKNGLKAEGSISSADEKAEWYADINSAFIKSHIDLNIHDEAGTKHKLSAKADLSFETGDTDVALYMENDGQALIDMYVRREGMKTDASFSAHDGENHLALIRISGENEYEIEGFIKESFYVGENKATGNITSFKSFFKKEESILSFNARASVADQGWTLEGTAERTGYIRDEESWTYTFAKNPESDNFLSGFIGYTAGKRKDEAKIQASKTENGTHAELSLVSIDGKDEIALDAQADFTREGVFASWTLKEDGISAPGSLAFSQNQAELNLSDGTINTLVQMQYDLSSDLQTITGSMAIAEASDPEALAEVMEFRASFNTATQAYEVYMASPPDLSLYYSFDGEEYIMQYDLGYMYYDLKGRQIKNETSDYLEWNGTINGFECVMRSGWKFEGDHTRIYFEETIIDGQKDNLEIRLVYSHDEVGVTVSGSMFNINGLPGAAGAGIRLVDENHLFASAFAESGPNSYAISLPVEYELSENLLKSMVAKLILTENNEETTLAELTVNGEILETTLPHIPATPITGGMLLKAIQTFAAESK